MITLEDCIAMCGLTEEEVLAIAEHEHIPEIVATAEASYLLNDEHGIEKIRDMIIDDIKSSLKDKNTMHASELIFVLNSFLKKYPEAKLDDNQ